MSALPKEKPSRSCSSPRASVRTSSKIADKLNTSLLVELVKPWAEIPEAVIHPQTGRVVALQRDAARGFGVADASILKLVKEDKVRRYAFKFLDLEDVSVALNNRRPVGRPKLLGVSL